LPAGEASRKRGCWASEKRWACFANLRPVRTFAALLDSSPLKNELVEGTDMIIVRELTGGIYYGTPRGITGSGAEDARRKHDDLHARGNRTRIAHVAFHLAQARRGKVTSVDKSNVLENSQVMAAGS
jgi:3-isopropylmalate dehydrogenase